MNKRKREKDKGLTLLMTPQKKSRNVSPVQKDLSMEDWINQNCTHEFRSKHLSMNTESAINLATTIRRGDVKKSTVIVLDSYSSKNAFKSIELKPKESYALNFVNMVSSTILNWERGSGSILLKTNEKSKIYHLENAQIKKLKESKKVAQGKKIRF